MLLLTYSKWQDFHKVIQAASEVYQNSGGEDVDTIFMAKRKDSPNASKKYPQLDYELTRHACYLVVLSSDGSKPVLEQKARQKLLENYEHGLWDNPGDDQGDQQRELEQNETIELGVKITIEPLQDDLQFTLAYVDVPVPGAEYTSLSFSEPVSTLIHLYWLPQMPDDRTCAAVMAALDTYLATIIEENEQLNTLYSGKSPFHA